MSVHAVRRACSHQHKDWGRHPLVTTVSTRPAGYNTVELFVVTIGSRGGITTSAAAVLGSFGLSPEAAKAVLRRLHEVLFVFQLLVQTSAAPSSFVTITT